MELIKNLAAEGSQYCESPWPSCHFDEDFILVSEFSELEGPRPLLTIPEDGGGSFNKNTFTVRIMSVDCTAPISSCEAGMEPGETAFKTVGDTQVVLVEPSEGAIAYVHHFTLYDIHARGFVRPFCMAYITHQSPKIMSNFNVFLNYFLRVSSYFKFGNAMVFLQDLRKRKEYLTYTKGKLLENDKPIGSCYRLPLDMKGFNFQSIEDCLHDSNELQNVICAYLNSDIFLEQRSQYTHQFESLFRSGEEAEQSLEELDKKFHNFQPRSVGISSGRKFDVQLRTLADLSSPSKQEAFALLQETYFSLRRTKYLSEMYEPNPRVKTAKEQHNIEGNSSQFTTKIAKDVFLSAVRSSKKDSKSIDSTDFDSRSLSSFSPNYAISNDFNNACDPNSQWTFSSFSSRHNSFEVIQGAQTSSAEDNSSFKDPENCSITSNDPSLISILSTSNLYDAKDVNHPVEPLPGTAKRVASLPTMTKNTFISRQISRGSDDIDSTGSPSLIKSFDKPKVTVSGSKDSNDSFPEANRIDRQNSVLSYGSNKSSSSNTSTSRHAASDSTKDSKHSIDLFDPPPPAGESSDKAHGVSLVNLRKRYSFFCHLVYSLMIGRPVVISAEKINRHKVHCIIMSLLPCIPGFPGNKNSVVFWTTGPFHILNLASTKLVGLAKQRGKDPVPKSVLPYVTVFNFEDSTLTAPPYEGTYLNTVFEKQKDWPSASVFLESLHSAQIELSTQAFVMFSLTFADSENAAQVQRPELRAKQRNHPTMKINPQRFFQFRFPPHDVKMVEYLMEILKDNLRNSYHRTLVGDVQDEMPRGAFSCIDQSSRRHYCESPSIKLSIMKCQLLTNATGKKK